MAAVARLAYRHDRESVLCGKVYMDDFLVQWESGRGEDEQLWVVVPEPGGWEVMAYYAVEPDPLDPMDGATAAVCDDGVIYVTGLATDLKYQSQGWAERLLLR